MLSSICATRVDVSRDDWGWPVDWSGVLSDACDIGVSGGWVGDEWLLSMVVRGRLGELVREETVVVGWGARAVGRGCRAAALLRA